MHRFIRSTMLAISILMVVVIIAGCSKGFVSVEGNEVDAVPSSVSPGSSPTNGLVQSNTGAMVTIDVEWLGLDDGLLLFSVALNTHSVDLDQYDLGELAVLRDDEGTEYHPTYWDSAPGGHHKQGILHFPSPDSLSQGKAKYVEIVIRDIDNIKERILKWDL